MTSENKIKRTAEALGVTDLQAWRYLRDQEILRRRYQYQDRQRIFAKW